MSSHPDLLRRLAEDPDDDDATYLVYADWLAQQDWPEARAQAELIAVQHALATRPNPALRETAAALLARHGELLAGEAATLPRSVELSWHLGHVRRARIFTDHSDRSTAPL